MTSKQIEEIALGMLAMPMTEWRGVVARLSHSERLSLARVLSGAVEKTARCMAYVEGVEYADLDYDDEDHRSAVQISNDRARQIRKALGYTYPDQPVNF